jgi:hypothetical protein
MGVLLALAATPSGLARPGSDSAENFQLDAPQFSNWKRADGGPIRKVVYRHPEADLRLQATLTQVRAGYNPTPELDSEALANQYVRTTREKMPTFRARRLGRVDAGPTRFELVERVGPDRAMVCAIAVRGNTTAVVSLIGVGKDRLLARRYAPQFRRYLKDVQLVAR